MNRRIQNRLIHRGPAQSRNANRQGASATEFAMVFPLILFFFMAMVVLTQAFVMRDVAQHAAYEGARKGLVLTSTPEDVELAVDDFLTTLRLENAEIYVEPNEFNAATNEITVTVYIPFSTNAWVGAGFMPGHWASSSTITLRRIQY